MSRVSLRFWGHACVSVEVDDFSLCLDPYESGDFDGAMELRPLPDVFDACLASHKHSDHRAFHTIPSAHPHIAEGQIGPFQVSRRSAAHDEFGGRLRGGHSDLIELRYGDLRIVHCGDLGERPEGALLEWLTSPRVDMLIVPIGGYFTLGADGAAELVSRCNPRFALAVHSADDGLNFPQLEPVRKLEERLSTPLKTLSSPLILERSPATVPVGPAQWVRLCRSEVDEFGGTK